MSSNHMKKSVVALQENINIPSFESFYLWWILQEQEDKNYTFNFKKYDGIKSEVFFFGYNGKEE